MRQVEKRKRKWREEKMRRINDRGEVRRGEKEKLE